MAIRTLIDSEKIDARVHEMGAQITREYAGKEVVLVPVLKGSFMFAADLARHLDLNVSLDFLAVRSYADVTKSSGQS